MDSPLTNDGEIEAYRTYEIGCDALGLPPMEPAAFRRIWGGPDPLTEPAPALSPKQPE